MMKALRKKHGRLHAVTTCTLKQRDCLKIGLINGPLIVMKHNTWTPALQRVYMSNMNLDLVYDVCDNAEFTTCSFPLDDT